MLLLAGCSGGAERTEADAVDCAVDKCVALTFDDGPGPFTDRLLGVLADAIGLRDAVLAVTALAALGVYTSRPERAGPEGIDEPVGVASHR